MGRLETLSGDGPQKDREDLARLLENPTYEVFPPKDTTKNSIVAARLKNELPETCTVAVTKHFERTPIESIDFAKLLHIENPGWTIIPHVAARSLESHDQALEIAEAIHGISNRVFVIGGDNSDEEVKEKKRPFNSAMKLLNFWAEHDVFFESYGVAAYPTGHKHISDEELINAVKQKQEYAKKYKKPMYIVTQMCLDTPNLVPWINNISENGIVLPIMLGIPGVVGVKGLIRFLMEFGKENIDRIIENHPELKAAFKAYKMGIAIKTDEVFDSRKIINELISLYDGRNFIGLHVTSFNQPEKTLKLFDDLLKH